AHSLRRTSGPFARSPADTFRQDGRRRLIVTEGSRRASIVPRTLIDDPPKCAVASEDRMVEPTPRRASLLKQCSVLLVLAAVIVVVACVVRIAAAHEHTAHSLDDDRDANEPGTHHRGWPMIGHDPADTRSQPFEHILGPSNVHGLTTKWIAPITGDVSATPAVADGAVYFGDFGGTLWKLNAETGEVMWSHLVADYTGIAGDLARTSPSLFKDILVVGDLKAPKLLGIDTKTGALRWMTDVHPDPKGIMTGSPMLAGDTIFTGISASGASGPNATFRGAIVAVDAQTGHLRWRTYSLPDNGGVPGGYA